MVVGAARFELAAFGSQNRCATRLRYAPWPCQYRNAPRATRRIASRAASIRATYLVWRVFERRVDHLVARVDAERARQAAVDFQHRPHIPL